jgi:arginine decarboxylase
MEFRRAMVKIDKDWGKSWWFKVWGPETLPEEGIGSRQDWMLKSLDPWHGFGAIETGFNLLDPVRATVLTPGLAIDGSFEKEGIPANIVAKYLAEHGVIVEKCGLYSFFIMFTIGITKGRWNTMVAALLQFKEDFDKNKSMSKAMPKFVSNHPEYENVGLKDLCLKIHNALKEGDVARTTTEMYVSEIEPAMKPADAFFKLAHEEVERVDIEQLEGKATAVLLTPYPPGIPLLIPGEKFNKLIVNYLKFARNFNQSFPGFETDIHGLVVEKTNGILKYSVDCLKTKSLAKIRSVPRLAEEAHFSEI